MVVDNLRVPLNSRKIRKLRQRLGLTQEQAAQRAELPGRARWNEIENGKVTNITIETLDRIAHALGVRARDLLR